MVTKPNSIALRIALVADDRADLVATLRWGFEWDVAAAALIARSEEHTSELQSLMRISYAVFCLKKKNVSKIRLRTHVALTTDTQTLNIPTDQHTGPKITDL